MSHRTRASKTSAPSTSKKKLVSIRKMTRRSVKNKTPVKHHLEQTSPSTITQPRQKRLSSLTAATLLQFCTSIRNLKSTPTKVKNLEIPNISENKSELLIPTRTRREASSLASAMIMQQNEIERSRYNYSTPTIRRHRSKTTVTNKEDIPPLLAPAPSIAKVSNQADGTQVSKSIHSLSSTNSKYPSLTEAILAEHDLLQEAKTTKHDNLLKWTEELALCGRLSPPYPSDEISSEFLPSKSVALRSNSKEITSLDSLPINLSTTNNLPTSNFLFPSSVYPLGLRSFYPFLPCWQYSNWPFQSSTYPIPSSSINSKRHRTLTHPETKTRKSPIFNSIRKQIHTHHYINNSNSTKISLSPEISSSLVNIKTKLNVIEKEHQQISPNQILNKRTTRRKSSPVKRLVTSESIDNKIPQRINFLIDNSQAPVSNLNDNSSTRRVPKRRSVSAVTTSTPTIVSITGRNSRGKRTNSASNRKRSHSPASITLPFKKQKNLHYWILSGKSEQKLVSIHTDKLPVFRECYSSIRHITEKDVIKSNDCVIIRSETDTSTSYLAKVKWFWEEPITGEIQMSLIWYYHPEHTELPSRVKEQFLPNEVLASKYWDCLSVECIEDKCYVLNFNEYNRYCLREKSVNLFEYSEPVGQLKFLLNKNTSTIHHRPLPAKTVGNQNIFFCRYVYDYRAKRILKNPTFLTTASSM